MKKEYDFVDLLKFLGSVMIFSMHAGAFSSYGEVQFVWELMSRWAVPVFFMLSAYFLFCANGGNVDRNRIKKYVIRIGLLYLLWFVYNIPDFVYYQVMSRYSRTLYDLKMLVKNSILGDTFTGSWYLASSIFCALTIYILNKKFSAGKILCFTFVIQLLCIFSSVYKGLLPAQAAYVLNQLRFPLNIFGGLFYFSLGLYFAQHQELVSRMKPGYCIAAMVCSFALYCLEIGLAKYFSIYGISDQAFSLIPLGLSIFMIGIQSSVKIKNAKTLRKMSIIIYCAQGSIFLAKDTISKCFGIESSLILFAFCALAMSFVIAVVFLLQKKHVRWAYYLT